MGAKLSWRTGCKLRRRTLTECRCVAPLSPSSALYDRARSPQTSSFRGCRWWDCRCLCSRCRAALFAWCVQLCAGCAMATMAMPSGGPHEPQRTSVSQGCIATMMSGDSCGRSTHGAGCARGSYVPISCNEYGVYWGLRQTGITAAIDTPVYANFIVHCMLNICQCTV